MSELAKSYEIVFKSMVKETEDLYSFIFEKPEGFKWEAGEHAIFRNSEFNAEGEKNFRIFSFASIVEEDFLMFSTRISENSSEYKKKLLELKAGDKITVENPSGNFKIENFEKPILIMAGGIGITPVRSLLKQMDLNGINPKKLKVLYSDDRGEFAFEDTLKEINGKYDGLEFVFISDRDKFMEEIEIFSKQMMNDADYFISGTPGMNRVITEKLLSFGVEKTSIKTDNFVGY